MPNHDHVRLPHIVYSGMAQAEGYTYPKQGPRDKQFTLFTRDRVEHAKRLFESIARTREAFDAVRLTEDIPDSDLADYGLVLRVESEPGFPLKVESLDRVGAKRKRDSIELLNVTTTGMPPHEVSVAAVYVPYGKLDNLEDWIVKYQDELTRYDPPRPPSEDLFANIHSIGYAALEALWTDNRPLPAPAEEVWWEVWIRRGNFDWEEQFVSECMKRGIDPGNSRLRMPEHIVRLVKTTRGKLESSLRILNTLAEVRSPRLCSLPFIEMDAAEQNEWVEEAVDRIVPPGPGSPAVCLLDRGVNRGHKLLEILLHEDDMHTVHAPSGTADHALTPHGTQMAGLAAYGNLTALLNSTEVWQQEHCLESVKLLKDVGEHEPQLYGVLTQEAISRPEIQAQRLRSFSNSVTAPAVHNDGRPSSWSAALDSAAAGVMDGDEAEPRPRRIIFSAAGNYNDFLNDYKYPDTLFQRKACIEDPSQSWNAITVGAITHHDTIWEQTDEASRCIPIAQAGELSPTSRTSCQWTRYWPYKPDIVMEGGNIALSPDGEDIRFHSLRPLTTSAQFPIPALTTFSDTSAATALAARIGARLQARYPELWPETIRGLVVHSARWTPGMLGGMDPFKATAQQTKLLLRKVGWGEPDEARAMASAENKTTIICENEIQPFKMEGSAAKTNHWHIHALPWPEQLLQEHLDAEMTLRVTLSYFVEPNPGSRVVAGSHPTRNRYRYGGCALRFEVKGPTESKFAFQSRLNRQITGDGDDDEKAGAIGKDRGGWALDTQGRRIGGSLHQDVWKGPAANLARMDQIAVLPVKGWWATRKFPVGHECHNCHERKVRYSLIVSIETEAQVPLYSSISTLIPNSVMVEERNSE